MTSDDGAFARAREYALLSCLLLRSPGAALLGQLVRLEGDDTALGVAHAALAQAAAQTDEHKLAREYANLFIGVGRAELLPYASFYLTNSLHGRPLADLRQLLLQLGIERAEGLTEPEDHGAVILEIMSGLTSGDIAAPPGTERHYFDAFVSPWMGRFFKDLELSQSADFYARVGVLGQTLIAIEIEAYTLPP